jgi:uncharacterized membrane protein
MRCHSAAVGCLAGLAVLSAPVRAHAWVTLSGPMHTTMVFLHILGAVVFLGNIIVSAMWMAQARRKGDIVVLHFAARSVMRADWLFTLPGIVLILVTGLLALGRWGGFPGTAWVELALTLFIVSGVIWLAVLLRLQRQMVRLTAQAVSSGGTVDGRIENVLRRWMVWGGIATLLPLISLVLMVFKPALWR